MNYHRLTATLSQISPRIQFNTYFTFCMTCSSEISIQWLLRLVLDVAVSSCQRTVWLDTCAAGAQLSVVAGRSGCRSVSFSVPTYVGCMSSCSGHFWVGSLKPIHHGIVLGSILFWVLSSLIYMPHNITFCI